MVSYILVTIDSGDGLLPVGIKPLVEPMLTYSKLNILKYIWIKISLNTVWGTCICVIKSNQTVCFENGHQFIQASLSKYPYGDIINGCVQDCSISIANAQEIPQSCTKPQILSPTNTLMAKCKAAVTPLLTHWSYCSLPLSHRYMVVKMIR